MGRHREPKYQKVESSNRGMRLFEEMRYTIVKLGALYGVIFSLYAIMFSKFFILGVLYTAIVSKFSVMISLY
jgi:hypothetical protein